MQPKIIVLIAINVALAAGAFALVALGKVEWPTAEAFLMGQLVPSVWGAFRSSDNEEPPPPTKRGVPPMPCLLLALFLVGCLEAKEAAAEKLYREEQEACLRQYEEKPMQRACVKAVRARWASDGGAE